VQILQCHVSPSRGISENSLLKAIGTRVARFLVHTPKLGLSTRPPAAMSINFPAVIHTSVLRGRRVELPGRCPGSGPTRSHSAPFRESHVMASKFSLLSLTTPRSSHTSPWRTIHTSPPWAHRCRPRRSVSCSRPIHTDHSGPVQPRDAHRAIEDPPPPPAPLRCHRRRASAVPPILTPSSRDQRSLARAPRRDSPKRAGFRLRPAVPETERLGR